MLMRRSRTRRLRAFVPLLAALAVVVPIGWMWAPDMPMFAVAQGDVVRMHITNTSGEVHPMHLHGDRMAVLARDGYRPRAARGGSTRWASATVRATTSRSWPTTRGSGPTTATT